MTQVLVMEQVPGDGFSGPNPVAIVAIGSSDIAKAQALLAKLATLNGTAGNPPAIANATEVVQYTGATAPVLGQTVSQSSGYFA